MSNNLFIYGYFSDVVSPRFFYWANYALPEPYAADHVRMKLNADSIQISSDEVHMHDRIALFDYGLNQTVRKLIQANKRVIILMDIPELPYFPVDCVKGRPNCIDSLSNVLARQATHRESLRKLKKDFPEVQVFDPTSLFCDASACRYTQDGIVLYRDSHHLTLDGSNLYGKAFAVQLRRQN